MTGQLLVILLGAPLVLLLAAPFFWAGALNHRGTQLRRQEPLSKTRWRR